jgi:queuine/archaeosine tRNA-ribosyltransferase
MQLDFFYGQTEYSTEKSLPYHTRLFAHNLVFYEKWMNNIRIAAREGNLLDLITKYVPASCIGVVSDLLVT